LKVDIDKHYECKPVIVILDEGQKREIMELAKQNKWRCFASSSPNYLSEIRQWNYGMLVLSAEETRGVDSGFKRAAHVIIID
jgi:hypothetical protein